MSDPGRENIRPAANDWIRRSGHGLVDFDAAIRSGTGPSLLAPEYAAPARTHPDVNGEKRLARAMAEALGHY